MFGTGEDLNTGAFVTLNGKRFSESISDIKKALSEVDSMGTSKTGTVLSWLMGNFNKDYDFVKDLTADTFALQKFKAAYETPRSKTYGNKGTSFDKTLKNSSVIS